MQRFDIIFIKILTKEAGFNFIFFVPVVRLRPLRTTFFSFNLFGQNIKDLLLE